MKLFAIAALFFSLSTAHAQDAASGESRHASMETIFASGFYLPSRSGVLAVNYSAAGRPSSLTLSVKGRKFTAWVWQSDETRCGDRIRARLALGDEHVISDLQLIDYSNVRCRIYVRHKWHLTVDTREADGTLSKLEMEGDPEN